MPLQNRTAEVIRHRLVQLVRCTIVVVTPAAVAVRPGTRAHAATRRPDVVAVQAERFRPSVPVLLRYERVPVVKK